MSVSDVPMYFTVNDETVYGFNPPSALKLTEARTMFFSPQLTSP